MAVKIGSARSNEKGKINGGKPGDQKSGKEVMTQNWYLHKKGWVIIRLKDPAKREKAAYAMEAACKNNHFGYGQDDRSTGYTAAKKVGFDPAKVTEDVNIDCSELVRLCLAYAGVTVPSWSTAGMKGVCKEMKDTFEVIEGSKAQTSAYLLRGDILVTKTKGHTVIVLSDGSKAKAEAVAQVIPDLSHYETVTDWAALMAAAPFLISKATQGTAYIDPTLDEFIRQCEAYKKPYWLYALLNKGNELAQAKFLVSTCKSKVSKYFRGYILDVEKGNDVSDVKPALEWISKKSPRIMLYTGYKDRKKYDKQLAAERPENCAWWQARYGKNNGSYSSKYPPSSGVDLHQFTEYGSCPGVSGNTDLNRLTGRKPLEWFTEKAEAIPEPPTERTYAGEFPKLPGRGYYTLGDGYNTLPELRGEIMKIQKFVNWINGGQIKVDGMYGRNTVAAVKLAQTALRVTADGEFGKKTLAAAKAYSK